MTRYQIVCAIALIAVAFGISAVGIALAWAVGWSLAGWLAALVGVFSGWYGCVCTKYLVEDTLL